MDYRQPIFSVVLIIMLIACPLCLGQEDGETEHSSSSSSSSSSSRVLYHDVFSQGEQHYRLFESHHRVEDGVQNNAKINIETSVHHGNEDKVLVHQQQQQQQKGQRQKLNKHGNEIIINPSLRVSMHCTGDCHKSIMIERGSCRSQCPFWASSAAITRHMDRTDQIRSHLLSRFCYPQFSCTCVAVLCTLGVVFHTK